jgi:RHS repeat-associated protein
MFVTENGSTTTSYPLYDVHGNMIATVQKGSSGTSWTIHDQRSYDVWGSVRSGATTGGPRGRYCANLGHVQDDESGLVYMRARYYEPGTGRFISEDPALDGANWYTYCANIPNNCADRTGKARTYSVPADLGTIVAFTGIVVTFLGIYAAGGPASKLFATVCLGFLLTFMVGEVIDGYKSAYATNDDKLVGSLMVTGIAGVMAIGIGLGIGLPLTGSVAAEAAGIVGAYLATVSMMLLWMECGW